MTVSRKWLAVLPTAILGIAITSSSVRAQTETSTPALMAAPAAEEVATAEPAPPAEAEPAWYQQFEMSAFADGYFLWSFNEPPAVDDWTLNQNPFHNFVPARGFSLNSVGLNVVYPASPVGATINLRFGTASERFGAFSPIGTPSLEILRQGFATWAPTDKLTLDVGRFDTPFGAEVSDSFLNMNYTRGLVWFNLQPVSHTGLRLGYAASEAVSATFIVVNGWNNVIDNNDWKSVGAQVAYAMGDLKLILGGIFGREAPRNAPGYKDFRVLVDFIATYTLPSASIVLNGDFFHEGSVNNVGAMLGVQVPLTDTYAAAVRGEFVRLDSGEEGADALNLASGTLTFDVKPHEAFLIRAEGRIDYAGEEGFPTKSGEAKKYDIVALVGVVAHTY